MTSKVRLWIKSKPRSAGFYASILGILVLVVANLADIRWFKIRALALTLVFVGLWAILTGRVETRTEDAPMWWTIGVFLCLGAALALSWVSLTHGV